MPELATHLRDLFLIDAAKDEVTRADSSSSDQKWHFTSRFPPPNSGDDLKASYGGSTLAMTLMAASKTVDLDAFSVSSALGHFLGPANPSTRLCLVVHDVRTTLSFCTRHVQVYQNVSASRKEPAKQHRRQVMTAVIDYQRTDAPQLFEFSAPPEMLDPNLHLLSSDDERCVDVTHLLQERWPADVVRRYQGSFGRFNDFFENRVLPYSPQVTNAYGHIRDPSSNPQAHLPLTDRTNASWAKTREKLADDAERVAATTFYMDAALAFLPLVFNNQRISDAAAVASSDFAIRFFSRSVPIDQQQMFHQQKTVSGSLGRIYSTGRLWDADGKLYADMSQQCILRARESKL